MDKLLVTSMLSSFQVLLLLLLLLFLGVVHATATNTHFNKYGATKNSLCSQTPHPELCNDHQLNAGQSRIALRDSILRSTLAGAQKSHQLLSAMDVTSFDSRAESAWKDCLELYDDAAYHLSRSINLGDKPTSSADAQTWLSAALTNVETCRDGFTEFGLSDYLSRFPKSVDDFSKLLSDSLAVNKAVESGQRSPKSRKLLSDDGFPEWVSAADRKLLQSTPKADIVVAQDGSGHYKTISEAVAASGGKKGGSGRLIIYVKEGVYKENVVIKRSMKNLMFIGDGIDATVVTGNKNSEQGSTTFRSATFAISGENFIAQGMTFENTAGPSKHQAVALRGGGDHSVFYGCSFKGYQDTLYVYAMRQFYRECDIYGTLDFIFGNAAVILQNCNIYVRKPMGGQWNTVTAQGRTDPNQNTGIVIHNSRITAAGDLRPVQGSVKTYLGRPWKQYSRTVIMKTALDGVIAPAGWLAWSGSFALNTLFYGEYSNTGSGAATGGRVKWKGVHVITSVTEAAPFSAGNFLSASSWIPSTGVPYTSGL